MISGESEDTLAEGRIVQATVRRMEGGKAICMLYSELNGFLAMEYYADDWRDIPELSDGLHEGDESMEIIFKMVEENPWDVAHEMDELSVVYGDESLPRLYENYRISSDQVCLDINI